MGGSGTWDLAGIWEGRKSPGKATWTHWTQWTHWTTGQQLNKKILLYSSCDCGSTGSLERIPLARRGRKIYLLFPKDSWSVDAPRVLVPMGPKELDNPRTTCQWDTVQSFTMFLCLLDYRGPSMNCRDQKTSCWRKRTSDDWAHDCIFPFQEMKLVVGEISMQGSASSTK